jgi:hypothetical protein
VKARSSLLENDETSPARSSSGPFVYSIGEERIVTNVAIVAFILSLTIILSLAISHKGGRGLTVFVYASVFLVPLAVIVLRELRHPKRIELTRDALTVRFWYRSKWTHDLNRVEAKPTSSGVKILLLGDNDTIVRSFSVPKTYPGYLDLNEVIGFYAK